MSRLNLGVLGSFHATLGDQPLTEFRTNKVRAMLIYLAVEARPITREALMALLWPGLPERSARANLRQITYYLRKDISGVEDNLGQQEIVPLLAANRQAIGLNPEAAVSVDAAQFEGYLATTQNHEHLELLSCPDCRQNFESAIALYRDHFLADFYLDDSNEFEEWAQARREAYRRQALDALEVLTTMAIRQKDYISARTYAERQLEIDDLREAAYRQLMEILALSGQRNEALAVYENCRRLLAEELGMAPTKRTTELYDKIAAGDLSFETSLTEGVRGYEIKDEIGAGAYGAIHRAVQPSVGREVAVKVIRRRYANDPEFIRRFEAEAQTVARLEHPFIVPLYDYWRDPEGAYLVMRYLRGGNLLAALEAGPWEAEPAAAMLEQVAGALAAAHRQGVVHRDIKPANILLDENGNAYLSDFGIAKDLTGEMQMTAKGAVIGTPDYISPEQILNDPVTPQSDIYSLGAVLYETLTGEKPFPDSSVANLIYKHLNEPVPLVSASRPDLPPEVDVVIQKATAKQPANRYASALEMAAAFKQAIGGGLALEQVVPPSLRPQVDEIYNPYKGLRAFQEADADDFFGREALVDQLIGRLEASRFLAVVGPSGSGKSSVVKAGLISALRAKALPGSEKWFVAEMVPGTHPLAELELALWPVAVDPPPSLVVPMERDTRGMLRTIRRILPDEPDAQLLLVIDQFEELFTLVEDEEQREFFIDSLLAALRAPRSPLRVVVTLRADFYDRPLQYETLGRLLKENSEIVLPLTAEELSWAVREPARRMGVRLESGLAEVIVADVAEQPGALPLLQYALTELFERRQDGRMSRAAYDEIDGVLGALGRRAEGIYGGLDEDGREAARQIFLRLVTLGEGVEDTRRRVLRSELESFQTSGVSETPEFSSAVIDAFGAARLLTFDHDPATRQPTVEVAHEALLREWKRLRGWLEESRYDVRLQRALAVAAAEWQEAGQTDGFLLRDARLDQFAGWATTSSVALTEVERVYLQASIAAREARLAEEEARRQRELETAQKLAETERARAEEQARAAGRLRQRAILLTGALVVAGVLAIAAFFFAQQSSANADDALAEADQRATAQANAESSEQEAVAQKATAEVEAGIRATAEAVALTAQGEAEDEAAQRATAEALAIREREIAESQAALATSRELASKALLNLEQDPELGIILALQALSASDTVEAQEALHSTIQGSRVRQTLHPPDDLPAVWLSYSPDGSRLFTSGLNGGTMWDMTTGAAVFTHTLYITPDLFSGYFSSEQSEWFIDLADFSPDGSLLALPVELMTGDKAQPGYISILDPETGEEMSVFLADESGIGNVTFNQDGSQLASTSLVGGKTTIWNVAETLATGIGQEVTSLCCHEGWAWSVKYDPNGSRLVTTGSDDTLKVWSVETGSELLSVAGLGARDAVFSPDGRYLVVGGERAVSILDAATGEIINNVPGPGQTFYTVLFSPDGTHLAASNFDGNVRIWNYADGELGPISLLLSGHKAAAGGISFTPDGRYLASGSSDGTARVWDVSLNGGGEFGTYSHDNRVMDVAFTPDGSWLVSTGIDNTAKIWDTAAEQERFTLRHDDWVVGAAVHPDGHTLATSSNDGTVRIWDANTGEQKLIIQAHETIDFGYLRGAKGIAFSPDGQRLATSGADKLVKVWDAETGEELFTMTGHTGTINAVAYSPDGRWLISASNDGAVKVWDPVDGHELWTLPGDRVVFEASFSLDSSRLVAGQQDGWVTIWSFPTQGTDPEAQPERLLDFQPRPQAMAKGVFSPDGNQLVIAGSIQTSIHDARTGELQVILGYPATKATFSPDGRLVATAGNDGLVRLFAADQEELLALAQSRVTRSLTTEECQQYLHLDACPVP